MSRGIELDSKNSQLQLNTDPNKTQAHLQLDPNSKRNLTDDEEEDVLKLRVHRHWGIRVWAMGLATLGNHIWDNPTQQKRQKLYHLSKDFYSWKILGVEKLAFLLFCLVIGMILDGIAHQVLCFFTFWLVVFGAICAIIQILRLLVMQRRSVRGVDMFDGLVFLLLMFSLNIYGGTLFGETYTSNQVISRMREMLQDDFSLGKTLLDIKTRDEFYQWFNGPFVENFVCPNGTVPAHVCTKSDDKFLKFVNPRLRVVQQIVPPLCPQGPDGQQLCEYPPFTYDLENKNDLVLNGTRIPWLSGKFLTQNNAYWDEMTTIGRAGTYPGSGLTLDISVTQISIRQLMDQLKQNGFIDSSSRVVFVDLVFATLVGRWVYARISFELPPSGTWIVTPHLSTGLITVLQPWLWPTPWAPQHIHFGLWNLALGFNAYHMEATEYYVLGTTMKPQIKSGAWQFLNVVLTICVAFHIFSQALSAASFPSADWTKSTTLPNFGPPAEYFTQAKHALSLAVYVSWVLCLQYLRWIPGLGIVTQTFYQAGTDLFAFFLALLLVLFGFIFGFHYSFGEQLDEFSTFEQSIWTMAKSLQGGFDANEMYKSDSSLGFIAFILFTAIVSFFVLTMLIAIITDAFVVVQQQTRAAQQKMRQELMQRLESLRRWTKAAPDLGNYQRACVGSLKGKPPYSIAKVVVWSANIEGANDQLVITHAPNPFVKVTVAGVDPSELEGAPAEFRTETVKDTDTPVWNHKGVLAIAKETCQFKFEVFDDDVLSNGACAEAVLDVQNCTKHPNPQELELKKPSDRTKGAGTIKVSISMWKL